MNKNARGAFMKIKNCMEDFVFQHLDGFLEQNQSVDVYKRQRVYRE